jgi:hypothetical protein
MYVDIIILSILNGLTSGPLVIQRLKALHRLGSSGSFDFYGEQHLFALAFIEGTVSLCTVLPLVAQGIDPEQTVMMNIMIPFAIAPLAFLGAMVFLMFRYLSHIIYSLLAT